MRFPTAQNPAAAIVFALDHLEPFEVLMFLADVRADNLRPWPEYVAWLKKDTEHDE